MAVSVGLVGTGTVGRGFLEILAKHHDDFLRHYHIDLQVTRVCSRRNDVACELGFSDVFTYDFHDILNDTSIDLVVELIGGVDDAFDIIAGAARSCSRLLMNTTLNWRLKQAWAAAFPLLAP